MSSPAPKGGAGRPGRSRRRRLGQHLLADPNLLDAIMRDSGLGGGDVALEVGGGAGALSERIAPRVQHLHVIEVDERFRPELEALERRHGNVSVIWADAMKLDLGALHPPPTKIVSNLPYSIATPLLLRTIEELPSVLSWTVMVQHEVAERLRAEPGSRRYGIPSVLVQLACEVELLRTVDRAVFVPRPRVRSALIWLRRKGPAAPEGVRRFVRYAFAHRRKSLIRSVHLAVEPDERETLRLDVLRPALLFSGMPPDIRAEWLTPEEFVRVADLVECY